VITPTKAKKIRKKYNHYIITPTNSENKIMNKSTALRIAVKILFEKNEQKD
jgi:hypothetical protein